jgi:predicted nucleotidyltransferase
LKPLSSAIRAAFVYGSVAKATDHGSSHIDLMIVSDSVSYREVFGALEPTAKQLGRQSIRPFTRPKNLPSAPAARTPS